MLFRVNAELLNNSFFRIKGKSTQFNLVRAILALNHLTVHIGFWDTFFTQFNCYQRKVFYPRQAKLSTILYSLFPLFRTFTDIEAEYSSNISHNQDEILKACIRLEEAPFNSNWKVVLGNFLLIQLLTATENVYSFIRANSCPEVPFSLLINHIV